jgi:hypothetical protein
MKYESFSKAQNNMSKSQMESPETQKKKYEL